MEYTYIHNHQSQFLEMTSKCQSSVKLSSIATYSIGLTYAPEDVNSDGIIVLRSGNIQDGSITLEDIVRVNKPIKDSLYVKKGNILMCSRNGSASLVGKTAIVGDYPERMTFGAFMTLIKTDIPEYINAFFSTPSFRYQVSMGKSSTMNQITQKMLDSIELPLVSVSEQEQFAEIGRQADKSKFDGFKSQFIEMFGDVDSFSTLENVLSETFPGEWGNEPSSTNTIKVIRTTNFTNEGRLDLSEVVKREIDSKKVSRKKLKKGDTILERSGGSKDNPVGRVVFFDEEGDYLFNNFTQVLRPKEEVNPVYLFYTLYNSYNLNKAAMRAMASQTTGIQNLSMTEYLSKQIKLPSKKLQDQFECIYRQADKSKYYEINET